MSGGPPGLYAPLRTASVASRALCRHRPGHLLPARTSQSVLGTRPLSRAQLLSGTPNLSMEKMKALLEMTDTLGSAILAFVRVMSRTFPSSRPQRRLWKTHTELLAARSVTGSRRAHADPGEPPDPSPGHRGRLALPVLQEAPPRPAPVISAGQEGLGPAAPRQLSCRGVESPLVQLEASQPGRPPGPLGSRRTGQEDDADNSAPLRIRGFPRRSRPASGATFQHS